MINRLRRGKGGKVHYCTKSEPQVIDQMVTSGAEITPPTTVFVPCVLCFSYQFCILPQCLLPCVFGAKQLSRKCYQLIKHQYLAIHFSTNHNHSTSAIVIVSFEFDFFPLFILEILIHLCR